MAIFPLFIISPSAFALKSLSVIIIPSFSILPVTSIDTFPASTIPRPAIVIILAFISDCFVLIVLYFAISAFTFSISALSVKESSFFSSSFILSSASSNSFSLYCCIKSAYSPRRTSLPVDIKLFPEISNDFPA